jgi:hypothetical protein
MQPSKPSKHNDESEPANGKQPTHGDHEIVALAHSAVLEIHPSEGAKDRGDDCKSQRNNGRSGKRQPVGNFAVSFDDLVQRVR